MNFTIYFIVNDKPHLLIDLRAMLRRFGRLAWFMRPLVSLLERCLGIHSLNQIYHKVRLSLVDSEHDPAFFIKTLQVMGVRIEIDRPLFEHLLQRDPLIVVANHPFGGLDGVVMGALLSGYVLIRN